ncbi:DUF2312 domain-containing protein [Pseudooceanicola sp. C21-150M6]|uniref:DUF2312 domain-containing protein n=1 Tax=Pseudooceanicola sp. C21-150M6 TaxID=3434355 RepID=UPI003D7FA0FA
MPQDLSPAAQAFADAQASNPTPAFKETDADRDVRDNVYRVTAGELRQFIERFEKLAEEKSEIADQQKAVMAEAKARGYSTVGLRRIIAIRKRNADDVAEEDAVIDLYKEALGMC